MERENTSRKRKAVEISDEPLARISEDPLYKELHREINTGYDDPSAIRAILQRSNFETFSEDRKRKYLVGDGYEGRTGYIDNVSLLYEVIAEDAVDTLHLLLPMVPTFELERKHIPEEYPRLDVWAAQSFLRATKSRWSPGKKCRCKSHVKPATTAEGNCAITKLASNALAAELFGVATKQLAISLFFVKANAGELISMCCVMYLLAVCPELLSTRVCTNSLALALVHIPELGEMFLEPRVLKYLHHSIEDLVADLLAAGTTRSRLEYVKVFVGVAGRWFTDKLLRYRRNGSTFLHIVCEMQAPFYDDDVYFVKLLLRLGFDPAETNDKGLTALDVLLRELYKVNRSFDENSDWDGKKRMLESLLVTVRTMLPYFKDKAIANLTLPTLSPATYDRRTFMLDMIKVWEVFLDVNLFPQFTLQHLVLVVEDGLAGSSSPCVTCEPLSRLVHREMCKGMPVKSPRINNRRRLCLLEEIMSQIDFLHMLQFIRRSTTSPNFHTASPGCCLWKTAELIIHSTAGLDQDTADALVRTLGFRNWAGGETVVPLNVVRRVVRMLWMYAPSSKPRVVAFLQRLATATDSEARDTASELLGMVEGRPKSLQMLARNSLVRAVEYKDIPRLPLPPRLLRYVQIGEMSDGQN